MFDPHLNLRRTYTLNGCPVQELSITSHHPKEVGVLAAVSYLINLGVDILETQEDKYLMVIESHNQATLLYNELLKRECKIELISTPNSLSKGCSRSIIFVVEDVKKVIEEGKKSKARITGIYKIVINLNGVDYINIGKS